MTPSMSHLIRIVETGATAITQQDLDEFMGGYCHALALQIHQRYGLPIVIVWAEDVDSLAPFHVMNRIADLRYVDVRGGGNWPDMADGDSWGWGEIRDASPAQIKRLMRREKDGLRPIPSDVMARAGEVADVVMSQRA